MSHAGGRKHGVLLCRLGWTGDLQVFTPTASLLYDTAGFLADWLDDLASEQLKEGNNVPGFVVPNVLHKLGGDPVSCMTFKGGHRLTRRRRSSLLSPCGVMSRFLRRRRSGLLLAGGRYWMTSMRA